MVCARAVCLLLRQVEPAATSLQLARCVRHTFFTYLLAKRKGSFTSVPFVANSPCALPGLVTAKGNIVKAYLMFMVLNFLSGYIFCFTAAFRCPYSVLLRCVWRCCGGVFFCRIVFTRGLKYPHSIAVFGSNQTIVEDGARAHEYSLWRQMQPMLRMVLWACAFSWFYFGSVSNSLCLCLARLYIIWCRFK